MGECRELSRRRLMAAVGIAVGSATVGVAGLSVPAQAAAAPGRWTGHTTQNGWPVIGDADIAKETIEGGNAVVALRPGAPATVLLHVVRRYHYEIETLNSGDIQGHTADRTVMAPLESNYLSGTAVVIRPGRYPLGVTGDVFPQELVVIRDILAECEGVVRWGGDDERSPKEGHFQIDVLPGDARLTRVAAKIRGWRDVHGKGAGAPVDPFLKARRSAAKALERAQRGH